MLSFRIDSNSLWISVKRDKDGHSYPKTKPAYRWIWIYRLEMHVDTQTGTMWRFRSVQGENSAIKQNQNQDSIIFLSFSQFQPDNILVEFRITCKDDHPWNVTYTCTAAPSEWIFRPHCYITQSNVVESLTMPMSVPYDVLLLQCNQHLPHQKPSIANS